MFDFADFYDRIAKGIPNNCVLCEVGVANGDSALSLARKLHELGKNFKLYMVDNMDYGQYIQMGTIYTNIIDSGLGKFIEVMPYDSLTASELFNDGYLDFCYIDSSHLYEETRDSIRAWYAKVKDGGILAGHDYDGHLEVRKAVDELIPTTITREPIVHDSGDIDEFEPEQFLMTEDTVNGYGLWWCKKDFYKKLNDAN